MVDLQARARYWRSQNPDKELELQDNGNGPFVPKGQPVTQVILEAIPVLDVEVLILTNRIKSMSDAVQLHLDTIAQSWGYDSIISLCTYDGNSDPKYSVEGEAGKLWRSNVWRYCENELSKIEAGTRTEPQSIESFIAELPTIVRPKI